MLWQPASASHDSWHAARLDNFPDGDSCRHTSPEVWSHIADVETSSHTIAICAWDFEHVSAGQAGGEGVRMGRPRF